MSLIQSKLAALSQPALGGVRPSSFNSQSVSAPAPILGWNARDALDTMDPRYALRMENYFPDGSTVRGRNGTTDHATGFPGTVEYIHTFARDQERDIIAFSGGNVYDASSSGTIGAPLATGFSSNRWFGANAGAGAGIRGIYVNGSDPAQSYDGTTWTTAGITGPTKPTGVTVSKKRVWLIENGTGTAYYGAPEQVSGAFNPFEISSVSPDGGELVAIGNLTVDSGEGPDDLTVFVTKRGNIILYAGTDPGDFANWSIRGIWRAGKPIGERCLVPFDEDLIYISNTGFQSLLALTAKGRQNVPISDAISSAVSNASSNFSDNYGWHGVYHPTRRQLLFNIPTSENVRSEQYVMNSLSRTWAKFTGWNAISSTIRAKRLFMATGNKIIRDRDETNDSGALIRGIVQTAWNYFGSRGREKHFKQFRPHIRTDVNLDLAVAIGTDFRDPAVSAPSVVAPSDFAQWNVSQWNNASWGGSLRNVAEWRGAFDLGFNASIVYETLVNGPRVELLSTDIIFEIGSQV